jgi:glycosyltransferase involved in cell wall biosynthesis
MISQSSLTAVPPSVSVAMGTYQGGRYLGSQLESISAQTSQVSEIVIADDGSTDDTGAIVESFRRSSKVPVVRWLAPVGRLGVTANFERAVLECTGDLIALADQDDVWHPNRIARQVEAFAVRSDLLLVHADAELIDEIGRRLPGSLFRSLGLTSAERRSIRSGDALAVFIRRNVATGATVMFRRDLLPSAVPFPETWLHDEWLAMIAAVIGEVDFVDELLIDYRQHADNQVGASDPSLRHRISRIFEPTGGRSLRLALRAESLESHLERLPGVSAAVVARCRAKSRFESSRSRYPSNRIRRLPAIARQFIGGGYSAFASQGRVDVVRDMIQPS